MSSRLGELLQRRGLLTPEQLAKALDHQREHGGALATYLVKLGLVSEDHLLAFIEREYRLPVVDPLALEISREVLNLVPPTLVTKHHLIPTYQPVTDGAYASPRRKNSTPGQPAKGRILTQHTGLPPRKTR